MKQFIEYVIKHWLMIVIISIVLFIGVSGLISRCDMGRSTDTIIQVDAQTIRRQIIDSMATAQARRDILRLDSITRTYERRIIPLKKEIVTLRAKLGREIDVYNSDTVHQSAPCDSIINTSRQVIDSLDRHTVLLTDINQTMTLKISVKDLEIDRMTASLMASYNDQELILRELSRQTNWWHRNDKWFYFGAGAILAFLIVR
jgi:hypothetical protein